MTEITDKLVDIHYGIENYKQALYKMNQELESNEKFIKDVFSKKFKIRGIHAKVDGYSIKGNWIDFLPAPPDSGIDRLTLSFKEFAQQVQFLD